MVTQPVVYGGAVRRGRAHEVRNMTLTLDWFEPGAPTTVGDIEVPGFTPRGQSPGELRDDSRREATRWVIVGGSQRPVVTGGVRIPLTDAGIEPQIDWECQVAETGEVDDPALQGRRFRVVGLQAESYATARLFDVVQVFP